jgi:hypothetical protein
VHALEHFGEEMFGRVRGCHYYAAGN